MGRGTLDATTIILGQNVTGPTGGTATTNGTLTVGATGRRGTVKVQTLSLGNQNLTTATAVTGTFNLNGGANLYAGTIDKGTGTGTERPPAPSTGTTARYTTMTPART